MKCSVMRAELCGVIAISVHVYSVFMVGSELERGAVWGGVV